MAFGQVNNLMAGDPWRNEINNIHGCWQKRGADGADLNAEIGLNKVFESHQACA
jgi:hypothetical protein